MKNCILALTVAATFGLIISIPCDRIACNTPDDDWIVKDEILRTFCRMRLIFQHTVVESFRLVVHACEYANREDPPQSSSACNPFEDGPTLYDQVEDFINGRAAVLRYRVRAFKEGWTDFYRRISDVVRKGCRRD